MKRPGILLAALVLLLALWGAAGARAEFGINNPHIAFSEAEGEAATQAGSHPFALNTSFGLNYLGEGSEAVTEGRFKDVVVEQIAGLVADASFPQCTTVDFLTHESGGSVNKCSPETAVGVTANSLDEPGSGFGSAVFNLVPPRGDLLRLGFDILGSVDIVIDARLRHSPPYTGIALSQNIPEPLYTFDNKLQLWGHPADPRHDALRGTCYVQITEGLQSIEEFEFESESGKTCSIPESSRPFLTLPTRCSGPDPTTFAVDPWEGPGSYLADGDPDLTDPAWRTQTIEPIDSEGKPQPFTGCEKLGFKPGVMAKPSTKAAQSPTGLDFGLDVEDAGLISFKGLAQSDIKKVRVTLPEGMTANPSLAEGLEVCSEAQLAQITVDSPAGVGCPEASKIGTIEAESPLAPEPTVGALYQATPYENEFGSLIAFYFVIKNPNLGVIVKQAAKVEADPATGQLVAVTDNMPQIPLSHVRLHFREGGRSPLISPPRCGDFTVKAELFPWSGGPPVQSDSTFTIISGPDEGPCPTAGVAPFRPGFEAGTNNNAAGAYSPFYMRLIRRDGEQDMTRFSAVLPPGVLGTLRGIEECPEAAIAAARARTGPHGGREELEHPSCPASSRIGRTLAGAGVGSQLTYVPGSIYLAGPVGKDQLSVVAITPALAGPFDAGTIVVREALTADPQTAEVEADGSLSDPIPHILKGIPLNVRDLRVYVDRPSFIFNATHCQPSQTRATLFGSYLQPLDPADDVPVNLQARYQASNCAALGFRPKIGLKLKGGTKRGAHPALKAVVTPKAGDANFAEAVVRLPHSAFLDQGHIRTICTRVQFAANGGNGGGCPAGSVYGRVKAWTPILEEPLSGPVYLRSSNHNLPDLVFALHGTFDLNLVGRLDSKHGGVRTTFTDIPDAPASRLVLEMQGGKKGVFVNSRNLCASTNRASAELTGQNGKFHDLRPVVQPGCGARKHR
jgi:hypothetical protein